MKLAHKIFILILGTVILAITMANLFFSLNAKKSVVSGVANEASNIATEAANSLSNNHNRVLEYELLLSNSGRPYLKDSIDRELREIRNLYAKSGVENVYTIMLIDGVLKIAGDPSEGSGALLTVNDYANLDIKKEIFSSGRTKALAEPYTDDYGVWISAYAPIKNNSETVVALLGVDLPLGAYAVIDSQINRTLLYSLLPAILLSALLSFIISRIITGPIESVVDAMENVKGGKMNTRLNIVRKDALGKIGIAFNNMASELEEKDKIKATLQQAISPKIAEKLLREDIKPQGELMEGTVLFADVRGFTSLSETITAQDTIEYINEFLSLCVPEIQNHGGFIEKFVGDEIFAVFGGPLPHKEDAVMAVKTALKIQNALAEVNKTKKEQNLPEINIGMGISTGVMIGGVIGTTTRNNYTLLGSTVNEGARICAMAQGGEIIISQSTYLRVQREFNVDKLPPIQVKGKEFSIHTFAVQGTKRIE